MKRFGKRIEVGTIGHVDHSVSANINSISRTKEPTSLWDRVGIEMQNVSAVAPKFSDSAGMQAWIKDFTFRLNELQEAHHKAIGFNIIDITNMLKRKPETISYGYTAEYIIHDADNPPQNVEIITKQRALHERTATSISSPIFVSFYLCKPETNQQIHQHTVAYCIGADVNLYIFGSNEWAEEFGRYRKEFDIK